MSLLTLRQAFLREAVDLLWGQWCALGVPGHSRGAGAYCIDPEALVLATCRFGRYDQRLFDGMLEWLIEHEGLLSLLRISSLLENRPEDAGSVVRAVAAFLAAEFKRPRWATLAGQARRPPAASSLFLYPNGSPVEMFGVEEPSFASYGFLRGKMKTAPRGRRSLEEGRAAMAPFPLGHPGSLWARLRAFMGVSTRTDALVYLLIYREGGYPSLIARELSYTQRGIQQALVSMSSSGWVLRSERSPRGVVYAVDEVVRRCLTSSFSSTVQWLTWNNFYTSMEVLWQKLDDPGLMQLPADVQSAELRGSMQTAGDRSGFSAFFLETRSKTGEAYVDSLEKAWKSVFAVLHE